MTAPTVTVLSEREIMEQLITPRVAEYEASEGKHPDLIGKPHGNPIQIRPVLPDTTAWAGSWVAGIQRNGDRWLAGIKAPRVSFKDAAIAKKAAWSNAMQAAIAGDHYAKGMAKANVDAAIDTAEKVGAGGWQAGAALRQAKFQGRMDEIKGDFTALTSQVRAMPAGTAQERENRALTMMRGLRAIGTKRHGG